MAKVGRKDVWSTVIQPNMKKIQQWLADGATEKQICNNLQIGISTWWAYKQKHPEFVEFILTSRVKAVSKLESAMFKSACRFERTRRRAMKVKEIEYENGRKLREIERIEYYDEPEYYPPDTTAGIFLMTNWAKDSYARDAATLELKKQELELKKEQGSW